MLAKSVPNLFQGLNLAGFARATRGAISVLVLMASLAALVLIVYDQYGAGFLGSPNSRVLSLGALKSGAAEPDDAVRAGMPVNGSYLALAEFLAKRYKVSQDVTLDLVSTAHAAGHQIGLDPLLIIAVIAVESRFNPIAESVAGAKGLMQIIPKYHADKLQEFGGEKSVFDPETNILVGAQILKEYISRTGNVSMALQMYAGALSDDQDGYTTKVLSEKHRLQQILSRFGHTVRTKSASADKASLSSPL